MKMPLRPLLACSIAALINLACTGSTTVADQGKVTLSRTTAEPAGSHCAEGGLRFDTGADTNGNGVLDDSEITQTVYVCNGASGQSVQVSVEPPGANCPSGGVKLTLPDGTSSYICNGSDGTNGTNGTNGTDGTNGTNGTDGSNGANGDAGADGQSVVMTPEPPGPNCIFGGVKLQVGDQPPQYICSSAPAGSSVITVSATDIGYSTAELNGANVFSTSDGSETLQARGVAIVAGSGTPDITGTICAAWVGQGYFTADCTGLTPGASYTARAFQTTSVRTVYGQAISFSTRPLGLPTVSTGAIANITSTTATGAGEITDDGGSALSGRGLCWGASANPSTGGSCVSEGTGTGDFLGLISGLTASSTVHVRAYATNAQGTAYGSDVSFSTAALPLATVTTGDASAVAATSAIASGTVAQDNGSSVTSRGFCWATHAAPASSDTCWSEQGGLGSFTTTLSNLSAQTSYHLRAFAVNGAGTSYGNEVTFTTSSLVGAQVTTRAVAGISSSVAISGGSIVSDGGSAVTAKGVCWSINANPTLADSCSHDGSGDADWYSTATGLVALTQYYLRAYATNAVGTAYGNQLTFTTTAQEQPGPTVPVVGTSIPAMATGTTAAGGGYVSNNGGSAVTARGLCWSTTQNPTLASSCSSDGGTGVGYFSSTVTGLSGCGVIWYVRAYATNSTGTGYGNQTTVSTGLVPTLSTAATSNLSFTTATSGGTISDAGGCSISARGVCWSNQSNTPAVGGACTSDGTGAGAWSSSITNLLSNQTYYVRAFATNSVGTTYGAAVTFTTQTPSGPYIGESYAGGTVFYVDGSGQHGYVAAPSDAAAGTWGCQGTLIGTGTALGTGASNTAAIVAVCSTPNTDASIADSLVLNGYSDWFLPSKDEFNLMMTNLLENGIGGFQNPPWEYFTSSENDANSAWKFYPQAGHLNFTTDGKQYSGTVRAARAF